MATTQDYINQLKEDKKNLVSMLNGMGVEASDNETFTSLTPKVGKIVTDPILQDKSIKITKNGTTSITADEGYNGLNNVTVTTDVPTSGGEPVVEPDYITDGLVTWFDGEDATDENNRWNSRIGDDYIYVNGRCIGSATTNPFIKSKYNNEVTNNFVYGYRTSQDYYNTGYTIEVVGRVTSKYNRNGDTGGWLIASNNSSGFGIGLTGDNGEIKFINDSDITKEKVYTGYYNKTFGASIYLNDVGTRDTSYKYNVLCSVNGGNWYSTIETKNANKATMNNNFGLAVMCYYSEDGVARSSYAINGGINCIRIYNRQLTNEELAYNHSIDKARFNLDE